jgi:hypothetical protein
VLRQQGLGALLERSSPGGMLLGRSEGNFTASVTGSSVAGFIGGWTARLQPPRLVALAVFFFALC